VAEPKEGAARAEELAETVVSGATPRPRGSGSISRPGSTPPRDSLTGARLDHFVVERRLGTGGMGAVYLARDTSLDRKVALKVLRDELTTRPDQEERFLREARAQAKLNHPNVVHIYYIGHRPSATEGGKQSLFFAMECVDGQPLEAIVDAGDKIEPELGREYMLQVARGLRAALKTGIVHRDVKPSNLLRDSHDFIKIADFGLAKPLAADVAITQEGAMVGSPLYMAPEQARGETLDHRADMYGLGATFYHLLAGRPLFRGETAIAVVAQHLSSKPTPLSEVAPHVPAALAKIVDRLVQKDRKARFESYDDLIDALEAAAPQATNYAGFWTRAAAVLIDAAIAGALIALIDWPGLVIHLLHVTLGHAFLGQTLAKVLLKIKVTRPNGARIGLIRSVIRTVVSLWGPFLIGATILWFQGWQRLLNTVSSLNPADVGDLQQLLVAMAISNGLLTLLFFAGLALAGFHPQKRALHDLVVGSVVQYKLTK
jgi:uncharacterized RDD family membrane protein YckC